LSPKEPAVDLTFPAASAAVHRRTAVRPFARGFALRAAQTAWLLGAGASADAHVPTASQLVDQLLATLYSSETGLRRTELMSDPRWQQRVRSFYDGTHGLPGFADNAFYSAIFERTYPDRDTRARFVLDQLSGRQPHLGQHLLAALVAAGLAPLVITTNFDTLLEDAIRPALADAADPLRRLTVLEPESATRAPFTMAIDARPLLIKIHGDLGAVTVKNTDEELRGHDDDLRAATLGLLSRYGLIVAGYSGRDPAVMRMLREVLIQPTPFPAGLAWVRRPEERLPDEVAALLDAARRARVEPVHEVEASGFMELMAEVERAVDLPGPIAARLATHQPAPLRRTAPSPTGPVGEYPQVRLAALPVVAVPTEARLLDGPPTVTLTAIREQMRKHRARGVVARRAGGQLVAFGDDADLAGALAELGVSVTRAVVPLSAATPGAAPDSTDLGLLAEALARALGRTRGITEVLRAGQRHLLRARDDDPGHPADNQALTALRAAVGGPVSGQLSGPHGARLPWAEALTLGLEWRDGRWWLLFASDVWVRREFTEPPAGMDRDHARAMAAQLGADFVRQRVAPRYNSQTGALLGGWLRLLTAGGAADRRTVHAFHLPAGAGVDAVFTFATYPLVSYRLRGAALRSTA
jgi:SIR2-like domain